MVSDYVRYDTEINISHGCRFREILHQDQHISWLQFSWHIRPGPQYLMAADFVRYYTDDNCWWQFLMTIVDDIFDETAQMPLALYSSWNEHSFSLSTRSERSPKNISNKNMGEQLNLLLLYTVLVKMKLGVFHSGHYHCEMCG